ncbi:elongation factor Tu [compost metagenome]
MEGPHESNGLRMRISDIFKITGRGIVITTQLEGTGNISIGNTIEVNGDEEYVVIGIDRFNNALGPSKNIGILIRGDLRRHRSEYYGNTIRVIKP